LTAKTILAPTSERRADRTPLPAVAGDRCAELGKALADYEPTLRCELTANDLRAARATLDCLRPIYFHHGPSIVV
jgi:hypothetical protein